MNADCKGVLEQLEVSWKGFTHRKISMTKEQVKAVLEYAVSKGYEHTGILKDTEIDDIVNKIKQKK